MGAVRTAVVFESVSGLAEDRFVHDYWFRWDGPIGPTTQELTDLCNRVIGVYNSVEAPQVNQIGWYMSREVSRTAGASHCKAYVHTNLGAPSGSATVDVPFTLINPQADTTSLPAEVAACVSVNADLTGVQVEIGTTRPQARRRGRTFIGPLCSNALALGQNVSGVQRPSTAFLTDLRGAIKTLAEDSKNIMALNAGLFMSVYSPTEQAIRDVVNVSTDNAFDSMRSRGPAPTARVNLAVDQS